MAIVDINPAYLEFLDRLGLTDAGDFLALRGTIISGHQNRHVVRVTLGTGPDAIVAFLKKEHRVPWRERLASACAGFGFISQSRREARLLQIADKAGVGAPEVLAAGEDGRGRAFVVVREINHRIDIRHFLRRCRRSPRRRRRLMRLLGKALARLHMHGLRHPDIYTKHVWVDPRTKEFSFLDWQRARCVAHITIRQRSRDLAALLATLPRGLVSAKDRRACLRAYCACFDDLSAPRSRERLTECIRRQTAALLRRRRVRELRETPFRQRVQGVVWSDTEALCMTASWHASLGGRVPAELRWNCRGAGLANLTIRAPIALPDGRQGRLVRRWRNEFWNWLGDRMRCRRSAAPDIAQAGLLYRLQRFGLVTPRLLAFGQHHPRPWQTDAFLLVNRRSGAMRLGVCLKEPSKTGRTSAERNARRRVIEGAARALRRIHRAGCSFRSSTPHECFPHLCVWPRGGGRFAIGVDEIEDLHSNSEFASRAKVRDFHLMQSQLPSASWSQTDAMRFLLAYMHLRHLTSAAKRLARKVIGPNAGARKSSDG